MSGGHFDYQQYRIREIADSIRADIYEALNSKPDKVNKDYWCISEYEHCPHKWSSLRWISQYNYPTLDKALREIPSCRNCEKVENPQNIPDPYFVHEGDIVYEDLDYPKRYSSRSGLDGEEVRYFFVLRHIIEDVYPCEVLEIQDETIQFMKEGYKALRLAEIYAQRVDWMMSGDDGEDNMQTRFKEDVEEFEKELSEIDWTKPEYDYDDEDD